MYFLLRDANSCVQHRIAASTSWTFLNAPKGRVSCPAPDIVPMWFIDTLSKIITLYVHRKE